MQHYNKTLGADEYRVAALFFETTPKGEVTIRFDLEGDRFPEPEAMENFYVDFEDFMHYIEADHPDLHRQIQGEKPQTDQVVLERLNAASFDWDRHLHAYLDGHTDLESTAEERLDWLYARRRRAAASIAEQGEADWSALKAAGEKDNEGATWDNVAHEVIDGLNRSAVKLYPELYNLSAEDANRLREILESHGGRLANELYGFVQTVRNKEHVKNKL